MAEENTDILKSISSLLEANFFIPSYQRGYRWTEEQVKDLLKDIDTFKPKNGEWYCLQPLVVKKCTQAEKEKYNLQKDQEWFELIDGQQRLTTITLIIHYFNEMWIGKQKIKEPIIQYQTRKGSSQYIKDIKVEDDDTVKIDTNNIDYFHISTAYQTIHDWVKNKGNFDNNNFQSKFKEQTKVIWYEINAEQDGRDIFSRINMGKIRLTNAELIKALFLNSSNFKKEEKNDEERIRLKQLEIATEWDNIETTLHNEEFWLFINQSENDKETRIEFIFELLVGKPTRKGDTDFTFREYQKKFTNNSEEIISENWKEVKRYFQTLQSWFEDRELYHKIGFLITLGVDIQSLIKSSSEKKKTQFNALIKGKIEEQLNGIQLDTLEYGNSSIRKILLLHNIQTMLNNEKENSRFPFNRYKREKWDIEHIHAIATEMKEENHQKDWLAEVQEFISDDREIIDSSGNKIRIKANELKERIANCNSDSFDKLCNDIRVYFGEIDINDISNLALLDSKTNRSYKNAVFPVKRKTIIEKEKTGTFVPICTKNVFMKYYSASINQMTFWGEEDRNAYFENIKEVLQPYLPTQNNNKNGK